MVSGSLALLYFFFWFSWESWGITGWLGLRAGWLGLRPGWMAQREDEQMNGQTNVQTEGKLPHSTGLRPLSGSLPKKGVKDKGAGLANRESLAAEFDYLRLWWQQVGGTHFWSGNSNRNCYLLLNYSSDRNNRQSVAETYKCRQNAEKILRWKASVIPYFL